MIRLTSRRLITTVGKNGGLFQWIELLVNIKCYRLKIRCCELRKSEGTVRSGNGKEAICSVNGHTSVFLGELELLQTIELSSSVCLLLSGAYLGGGAGRRRYKRKSRCECLALPSSSCSLKPLRPTKL